MHNVGIKARARTGAHPEALQITRTRGIKSFDLKREAPNSSGEHRYQNYLRKSKMRRARERERKTRVNEPRARVKGYWREYPDENDVASCLTKKEDEAWKTHVPRFATTDLAGSRNPSVGGAKSIPREHVLHPFQLRRRRGVEATKKRELRIKGEKTIQVGRGRQQALPNGLGRLPQIGWYSVRIG